ARSFLLRTDIALDKSAAAFKAGLGLDRHRLLCVPGNHDKMAEEGPERYLQAFRDLPAPPPFARTLELRRRRFTFYGIDSNLYEEGNVALGMIPKATFGWLSDQLSRASEGEVRILLLHHHPADLNRFRRWSLMGALRERFSVLEEGWRLLELCKGNVDV